MTSLSSSQQKRAKQRLDNLDIAIIRELSQSQPTLPAKIGLRSSYRDMAKRLRVSPGTVWNRVKAMHASGFLLGSSVYLNPSFLGLNGGAYAFDLSSSKNKFETLDRLKLMNCILFIHNHNGSLVGVFFVYKDEEDLQSRLREFRTLSGGADGVFSRVFFPPLRETLSDPGSVTLIDLLTQRKSQSYAQIARELDVSVRTVKRRMAKIFRAQIVLSSPALNYSAIKEAIPADLIVAFANQKIKSEAEEKIFQILGDYLIFVGPGEEFVVYNLLLQNIHAAKALANRVKEIAGVESVRAELVDEHIDLTRNLNEIYRKEVLTLQSDIS